MVKVIITLFFSDLHELNEVAHNCLFFYFLLFIFFYFILTISFIFFYSFFLSFFIIIFTKVSNYSETEVDKY